MTDPGDRLNELFQRYRGVCPDPDAGPGFMPGVWQKIEARRSFAWKLKIYARGLVSVAAALCLAIAVFEMTPRSTAANSVYTETYVEAIDSYNQVLAYADMVSYPDTAAAAPQGY